MYSLILGMRSPMTMIMLQLGGQRRSIKLNTWQIVAWWWRKTHKVNFPYFMKAEAMKLILPPVNIRFWPTYDEAVS